MDFEVDRASPGTARAWLGQGRPGQATAGPAARGPRRGKAPRRGPRTQASGRRARRWRAVALAGSPLSKLFYGSHHARCCCLRGVRGGPKWYRRADRVPAEQKLRSLGRSRALACTLSVPIRCGRILKRAMCWSASGSVCWRRAPLGVVWVQRRSRSAVSLPGCISLTGLNHTIHPWSRTP